MILKEFLFASQLQCSAGSLVSCVCLPSFLCQRAAYAEPPWFNIRTKGRRSFLIGQYSYISTANIRLLALPPFCIDIPRIDLFLINTVMSGVIFSCSTEYEPVRAMKKREELKLLTWVGQKQNNPYDVRLWAMTHQDESGDVWHVLAIDKPSVPKLAAAFFVKSTVRFSHCVLPQSGMSIKQMTACCPCDGTVTSSLSSSLPGF